MTTTVYLPTDEFGGVDPPDLDLAADYLELKAAVSPVGQSYCAEIVDALEMAADSDFEDVSEEVETRESVATGAVTRIGLRQHALGGAYPFETDEFGSTVSFLAETPDLGQAAYLVSLILSNLHPSGEVATVLSVLRDRCTRSGGRRASMVVWIPPARSERFPR